MFYGIFGFIMRLSTESCIQPGTEIFHHSYALDDLLAAGRFDESKSHHDGAIYFTPEQVVTSNCIARTAEILRVFDFTTLPMEEYEELRNINENWWQAAASLGYDGRLFLTADPFAKISDGHWCPELVIFKGSLRKITDLRRLNV